MIWHAHARRGLLLGGWLATGCGPSSVDAPGESESSGEAGSTITAEDTSTSGEASAADESDSGSSGSSSTGAPALPCAWVEGRHDAEIPSDAIFSNVTCDPDTTTATLWLTYDESFGCGDAVTGDSLIVELPPGMQAAGEYDLTRLVATVSISADLEPVAGQVDTGTLIITEVTPTAIVGWAHGGLDGYDFLGFFEAPYCP